jgi:hypothetical protein
MPGAEDHQLYPQVLAWAAWAEIMAGEFERAVRIGKAALDAAEALGIDDRAMCRVFASNSGIIGYVGDVEQMRRLGGRFVEAARRTDDDWELVQALSIAHVPFSYAGDVAAATELTDESLRVARRLGNPSALGYAAMSSGLARVNADPVAALPFFAEGRIAAESVGNQLGMASNLGGQAWIRIQRGEWREATPLVARCVQGARHVGNQQALGRSLGWSHSLSTAWATGKRPPSCMARISPLPDRCRTRSRPQRHPCAIASGMTDLKNAQDVAGRWAPTRSRAS